VVITALSNPEKKELIDCDFVSRFFGPNIGIAEDPVTGSAHCGLAPFFRNILPSSMDGKFLRGYQKSARGGLVLCRIVADKVELRGFCSFDKIDTIEI
jgi:predicted PhzF superfamily epimerase YddE/YHI9